MFILSALYNDDRKAIFRSNVKHLIVNATPFLFLSNWQSIFHSHRLFVDKKWVVKIVVDMVKVLRITKVVFKRKRHEIMA